MGPWQENGLTVSMTVARNARLRSNRTIKVPFATLSTTMQLLHQQGVSILSVGSQAPAGKTPERAVAQSKPAEAKDEGRKPRIGRRRRK